MIRPLLLAIGLLFWATPVEALVTTGPIFMGIGNLDPRGPYSEANDISADGTVVVGSSAWAPPDDPFDSGVQPIYWTLAEGLTRLNPSAHYLDSRATGVSGDGSVIVGFVDTNRYRGFQWRSDTGIVQLPNPPGFDFDTYAWGISDDGATIVGESAASSDEFQATIWQNGTAMGLGHLDPSAPYGSATDTTADGSVVIGGSNVETFRWTAAEGMEPWPNMPAGAYATSITADGNVVVGSVVLNGIRQAFHWTEATGAVGLAEIEAVANDVSADGMTVVGELTEAGSSAFYWTPETGFVGLYEHALSQGVLGVEGWTLRSARGISADGLTIVGFGQNPAGADEGWVLRLPGPARVPEPGTLLMGLISVGAAFAWRLRL